MAVCVCAGFHHKKKSFNAHYNVKMIQLHESDDFGDFYTILLAMSLASFYLCIQEFVVLLHKYQVTRRD